jgi:16S rRNA (adenine1518-N6/adenine1519-N6)-dimethyltransferase
MSHRRRQGGAIHAALAELGRGPRKRLGQHFLANPETARRIVALAALRGGEPVVEIGPGLGALTEHLLPLAGELWLVELDRDLAARLQTQHAQRANVHVAHADMLSVDVDELLGTAPPAVVVANLPYNVATPILARLLGRAERFARIVVMVQREVAERLRAGPGTKAYSALSVLTQVVARVERGLRLSPGSFVPPPKVDSEVVVITPHAVPLVLPSDSEWFVQVVRAVFSQRRKQLINSLRSVTRDPVAALSRAGIDPRRRPETLSIDEMIRLSAETRSAPAPRPTSSDDQGEEERSY